MDNLAVIKNNATQINGKGEKQGADADEENEKLIRAISIISISQTYLIAYIFHLPVSQHFHLEISKKKMSQEWYRVEPEKSNKFPFEIG